VRLWGTLGLYTGWSSVAVWLNLTTALIGSGAAPITTLAAILCQAAILAGAVGTAVAITWFTRGLLSYVSAVAWALSGVIVSTVQEGCPGADHGGRTRPGYCPHHRGAGPAPRPSRGLTQGRRHGSRSNNRCSPGKAETKACWGGPHPAAGE
jgi:hypothetical protein